MRANLARQGRRLLVCQSRSMPSCAIYATPGRRRPFSRPLRSKSFERTFFNALFQKPPREVRQPEYEPGWLQIMVWRSRMLDNLRPPTRKELMEAWRKLMQYKLKNRVPFNSTQALQCRRLLEYLTDPSNEQETKPFTAAELSQARQVLVHIEPYERSQNHLDLAKALYALWSSGDFSGPIRSREIQDDFLISAMCIYGGAQEALQLLYSNWKNILAKENRTVETVAEGLAREGREAELVGLVEYAEKHGVEYDSGLQAIMVEFFAQRDGISETKHWLRKSIRRGSTRVKVYRTVASFAMRNNLAEWATTLFLELGESLPDKKYWDVLLQAILITGKSLAEVDTMMSNMVGRSGQISPDIKTVNGLLSVAVARRDSTLGEDILTLSGQKGFAPNGETYLNVFHLHLETDSLGKAEEAYKQVRHMQPWDTFSKVHLFNEFSQLVNQYLISLSMDARPDFKFISSIIEAVEEDQMRLDPETVASLCLRFLENDQHFEVMDILSTYSFRYSEAEREVIQDAFVSFCLNHDTSTNRAWGAYQLLQQFFQDTSFERRVQLMDSFFDRKRPDMASHVFGHMRAHRNKSYHPTMEIYIRCLEGFAKHPDQEGLDMVHNMLKMDTTIQSSTRLSTALILAYTSCERPLIALDYWSQIIHSREGPSYNSIEAVFWTLEKKPGGSKQAREIWERIERMDLEIPSNVYNAYVGAIAGSGNEKEIRGLILKMASFVGSEPDAMTLGTAYNALPGQELQSGFEEWAKTRYREEWAELMKYGRRMNEYSLCQFRINRVMKA